MGAESDIIIPRDRTGHHIPYVSKSSGLIVVTESPKSLFPKPGVLVDVLIYTDGTNDATLEIYDNSDSATGTVLAKIVAKGGELMAGEVSIMTEAKYGMYVVLAGVGCSALIRYIPSVQ